MKTPDVIREELAALADTEYKEFQCRLMPTVGREAVLGVRMPTLRAYAKRLSGEERASFLNDLPHAYYDENNLHGILIADMKDFHTLLSSLEVFLPHIDNWATCDMLRPKALADHTDELFDYIEKWLASDRLYTVRFAIGLLLSFYLGKSFSPDHLKAVASLKWEEYYVRMMAAWYFATALIDHWEDTLPYLTKHRLNPTVHQMTLRKARESFRITKEQKALLKTIG